MPMIRPPRIKYLAITLVIVCGLAVARYWGEILVAAWGGRFANYTLAQDRMDFQAAATAWRTLYGTAISSSKIQNGDTWDFKYIDGSMVRLRLAGKYLTGPSLRHRSVAAAQAKAAAYTVHRAEMDTSSRVIGFHGPLPTLRAEAEAVRISSLPTSMARLARGA